MAYEAYPDRPVAHRVVLEQYSEGVYMYIFPTADGNHDRDYLLDDMAMAMRVCDRDFGIKANDWRVIPDKNWHGRH